MKKSMATKIKEITVNGKKVQYDGTMLTYSEICKIAMGKKYNAQISYTVTYKEGTRSGIVTKNGRLPILSGMILNVADTSNA